jgi:hypothetical protein
VLGGPAQLMRGGVVAIGRAHGALRSSDAGCAPAVPIQHTAAESATAVWMLNRTV